MTVKALNGSKPSRYDYLLKNYRRRAGSKAYRHVVKALLNVGRLGSASR